MEDNKVNEEESPKKHKRTLDTKGQISVSVTRRITREFFKKSLMWILIAIGVALASPLVGLGLPGWPGIWVSWTANIVGFYVGFRAIVRIREIEC